MNTINRDYRLDDVLEIIKNAKAVTYPELMSKTNCSRSTLKRDLRLLKKRYPQIKAKSGVNGGILWEDKDD